LIEPAGVGGHDTCMPWRLRANCAERRHRADPILSGCCLVFCVFEGVRKNGNKKSRVVPIDSWDVVGRFEKRFFEARLVFSLRGRWETALAVISVVIPGGEACQRTIVEEAEGENSGRWQQHSFVNEAGGATMRPLASIFYAMHGFAQSRRNARRGDRR